MWLEGEINEQGLRCGSFPLGKFIHNMWNQHKKQGHCTMSQFHQVPNVKGLLL